MQLNRRKYDHGREQTTLKRIEKGDISYFDSLMRVLRILGELDVFSLLIKEDEMRPNEYFEFAEASKKKQRKRARGNKKPNVQPNTDHTLTSRHST